MCVCVCVCGVVCVCGGVGVGGWVGVWFTHTGLGLQSTCMYSVNQGTYILHDLLTVSSTVTSAADSAVPALLLATHVYTPLSLTVTLFTDNIPDIGSTNTLALESPSDTTCSQGDTLHLILCRNANTCTYSVWTSVQSLQCVD